MQNRLDKLNERGLPPDPWKRFYEWRYDSHWLSRAESLKGAFPGFGWGLVLFSVLCGVEYLQKQRNHRK
jgi:hypothetical protein